jgi:hypothetical protein
MKAVAWGWLALLVLPGCLLIQPLDDAKPENTGGNNGKAGQHAGGGPSTGGAGNKGGSGNKAGSGPEGGSGPVPPGGAPNNGGAPNGVDFSLFLGEWTMTSATFTRQCSNEENPTTGTITAGAKDTFILGTDESQTDLIFDLQDTGLCDIYANVDDRFAYGTGDQSCTVDETDGTTTYLIYPYFEFAVSGDGQSAAVTWDVSLLNDADPSVTCDSELSARYQRTAPNN